MIATTARRLAAGLFFLLVALVAGAWPARAASRVVLLHSSGDDALSRQGATLLTAELQAAGFEVVDVERNPDHDLRQVIEATSARLQPVATFAIRTIPGGTAVEVWLEDRVTGKLVIRRVDVSSGPGAAADLALKAAELLRGSLLEVTVQGGRPGGAGAPAAPGEITRFVGSSGFERRAYFGEGVGFTAGAAMLFDGGLASAAPLLRLSWGGARGAILRLSATGLGSSPGLTAPEGYAVVHQTVLLAEGLRTFRGGARLQPLLGVAAGAYHVRSQGMGTSPSFPNGADATTAVALGAAGGVAARLGSRVALVLDVNLLLAQRTAILIASREIARTGGLMLMAGVSLCGVF